jgi:thiamine biosynthesis lipoprotein
MNGMKQIFLRLAALAGALLLLAGCGGRAASGAPLRRTVFAMDTVMNLTVCGASDADLQAAEDELTRLDAALARTRAGSDVYTLNHTGSVRSAALAELCARANELAAETGGLFDVTVAPVLALWGFGENTGDLRVPDGAALAEALSRVGYERLSVDGDGETVRLALPAQVDFGGVAKGFAADRLLRLLDRTGGAVLDLGGDVALRGTRDDGSRWRVAIRDPADAGAYLGVLETTDVCVMTSGVYERYFEQDGVRYHHILDPRTGYPADSGVVSATVVCESGVRADALATACCAAGADAALRLRETLADVVPFDLILVTDDARVLYTCADFTPEPGNSYTYEAVS